MDPDTVDRWRRTEQLFERALELSADERSRFLEAACADDPAILAQVSALVARHEALERADAQGTGFLELLDASRASALFRATAPASAREASVMGRYRIERELGRGGMGVVHLARDPLLERPVALKILPHSMSADPTAKRRFIEEARVASALDHPHIATVYEVGEADDERLFIAMAYYDGETLRERMSRGPLPAEEAAGLAIQVADGLVAAHDRGIVHRDIKPENLIITPGGVVKIVDFGVAKVAAGALTRTGIRLGTAAYMSPEQTRGERVDGRADIWALGVVLYEMLTGRRPFRGDGAESVIYGIRNDAPDPVLDLRPDAPPSLAAIVERCLEKDPTRRFPTATELAASLRALTPTARSVPGTGPSAATGAARTGTARTGTATTATSARRAARPRGPLARVIRVIREVHRRSLWQVLAVYLATSWFVLQASEHVVDRYLLPEWVYGFAVVLILTGLPIVLATAMVREDPLSDRDDPPDLAPISEPPLAPMAASLRSSPAAPFLTWSRTLAAGVLGFALLAGLAGFVVTRGVPRIAEARGTAGDAFTERGWIVVADFAATTENADVARAVREALTVDLQQSAHVNVHGRASIANVLTRMGLPDTTRLTVPVALEVAERAGAGAVLTADVSRLGGQYVLSGRALRAGTGAELFAVRTAAGEARLLDGVETLSREIRRRFGEERTAVRASRPLPEVTTPSLDALKLYAEAEDALSMRRNHERARALAMEAIRLDPDFAMAHRLAGSAANNMLMWGEAQDHARAAFALRDRLTDRERWHVEAVHHASVEMEYRRAADLFELILERYPDDVRAATNLGSVLSGWLDDAEGAYAAVLHARQIDPGGGQLSNAIVSAYLAGRVNEADSLAGIAARLGDDAMATRWRVSHAVATGDDRAAAALCDSALARPPQLAGWSGDREFCGSLDVAMGRIELGIARLEDVAREHRERSRYHPMANTLTAVAVAETMRGRPDRAEAVIDRLVSAVPADAIPDMDRLIIRTNTRVALALIGRPDLMERVVAAYPPHPDPDHWFTRTGEALALAAAEAVDGNHERALEILRAEIPLDRRAQGWIIWDELLRGLAFQELGQPDSAAVRFERAAHPGFAAIHVSSNYRLFLPAALRGLAEAHEARGDPEAALAAYQRLSALRSDADPELAGEVAAIRAAMARLGGEGN